METSHKQSLHVYTSVQGGQPSPACQDKDYIYKNPHNSQAKKLVYWGVGCKQQKLCFAYVYATERPNLDPSSKWL